MGDQRDGSDKEALLRRRAALWARAQSARPNVQDPDLRIIHELDRQIALRLVRDADRQLAESAGPGPTAVEGSRRP